ncbi:MAG: hypothetical protein U0359_10085 [Byssovorax sp.]
MTRPSPGARLAGIAAALLLVAAPRAARATGDPDLTWWTVETEHFRVHYPDRLEPAARRVAELGEGILSRVGPALGYVPKSKTEIAITDDTDGANGSATALPYNTIRLYATAPDDLSALGDYEDWYLTLLTHEYTHIAHTDNISGVPAVVNVVLGKIYSPNQAQPRWLLEGLATMTESALTSGGRIRSSLWDMYLRADVLDDRIAGLDQISSNAYRYPGGNLWYIYGSRFLRWITDIYGPNVMRAVSADYGGTLVPLGINRTIRRATGKTYVELFEGFKDYIKRLYAEQVRAIEKRGLREGTRITSHGRTVLYPRFVPANAREGKGEELVYFRDDSDERSGIWHIPVDAPAKGERRETLWARTNGSSSPTFTPAGDLVFHSISTFRNLYDRDDLFRVTRGERAPNGSERARKQLTVGLRAQYADIAPDGRSIVFTVNGRGTTYLEIAELSPEGEIVGRRDLVPSGRFDQAYTPRFSPDGKTVAYSAWAAGGYRDVRIVDVKTGTFKEIAHDRAMDMNPVWAPDGKTIYFASDRTGVFNIYAYDVDKGALLQVTNVKTGAMQPAVSADGKTLAYVGYTSYGHDLFVMPLDRARFLDAPPAPADRPDPPAEPLGVAMKRSPYNPLPTFFPHQYTLDYKPGNYSDNALTVSISTSDIVGIHSLDATLTVDPKAPEPAVSLSYSYDRLPVNLGVRYFHNVVPRSGYVLNDHKVTYDEINDGITASVSYPLYEDFATHNIGLSFSAAHFHGALPFGSKVDPYSTVPKEPATGNINILHLGYSYSAVEGSVETAGPARGVSFSVGLDYGGPYVGSSYTARAINSSIYGYIPMPWPGHHTLALRAGAAISTGSYPRYGTYSVGGYDLDNNDLPSTILSGVFNGAFVLRGYPARAYSGLSYFLQNIEYRAPILKVDHGISTLPFYLRRIDGALFCDWGGAFDDFHFHKLAFFRSGEIVYSPQLHTSIGAEIWLGTTLAYVLNTQFRIGYAYGFSPEAYPSGLPYFVASGAF